MAKYGSTWWGQQWLQSLSRIDFSNRLPRGRSYANKGAVQSVDIRSNTISARVQGSQRLPYKVTITVPLFSDKQKQVLENIIHENPLLLSSLLNKELSPELDQLARQHGVEIFPRSWHDFDMKCNCPDYAVPCKHLAAVLNVVANEVDRNPFVLFQLHGFDLLGSLGDALQQKVVPQVPVIHLLLENFQPHGCDMDVNALTAIDLSPLSVDPISVTALLAANPLFHDKDFKALLQDTQKNVSRFVSNQTGVLNPDMNSKVNDTSISIDFRNDFLSLYARVVGSHKSETFSFDTLVSILNGLEDKQLANIDYSWVCMHKVSLLARQLVINGLYYPRIFQSSTKSTLLFYVPALLSEPVKRIFNQMLPLMPRGLVAVKPDGAVLGFADHQQELSILCSLFIAYWVRLCYEADKLPRAWDDAKMLPELADLFIYGYSSGFNRFETVQIPATIHQWLSVFDIHTRRFTTILQVEEYDDRFALFLLVKDMQQSGSSPVPLSEVFTDALFDGNRMEILKDLNLLGNYLTPVKEMVASRGKGVSLVSVTDFSTLLMQVLPLVRLLGVMVLLPKSLRNLIRPQLMLKVKKQQSANVSVQSLVGLTNLLDYDWQVTLGEENLSVEDFFKMVKGLNGLVKIRDQYLFLDEGDIKALQKSLDKNQSLSAMQLLQATMAEEVNGIKAGLSDEVVDLLAGIMKQETPTLPNGLKATLRPYQQRGFEWLALNARLGLGSIIADDMGLGKTIQVISFLLHQKEQGLLDKKKVLVVVPTSLISNWMHEITRFAPGLCVVCYHGTTRKADFDGCDVVLTSYGIVRNSADVFDKQKWYAVVVDEAQNIKNHTTEQSKSIKKLKADYRIAMSGTPVENRLAEYWSIFDFVQKGYLGSFKSFNEDFAKPIHLNHDQMRITQFKKITAPFLLRRVKTDRSIISDLPDKVEANHFCTLTKQQAALYQNMVDETVAQLDALDGIQRKGLVLKLMMALKQIGNHPGQYLKAGDHDPASSGKSLLLMDLVGNILESNEKVLIFTQFREMGHLLEDMISHTLGEQPLFLHGGCSRKQRDEMVDRFQNGHKRVFILSLKAGGTGLNLTAASHVIHYDLWWNPAVESQATDRAYRIGQKKNVMVYRLINTGTLEEKIDRMIQEKRQLADLTVASGESWLGNLSNDEIRELVMLSGQ